MPGYKLTYFNIRGRGQAIRLLLVDQGIPFEEELVPFAEWPNMKPTLSFGQLPAFHVDGEAIVQSSTIQRYLGKQCGLYGTNDMEAAHIDMLNDSVEDIYSTYVRMIYDNYENGKEEFVTKTMPASLVYFEKWLEGKDGGKGYLMGEKMSYADYNFLQFLDAQLVLSPTCLDNFPLIKGYYTRVAARPKIAEFLKSDVNTKRTVNAYGKQ